nr:MAG TPA: hypothetical protein [Inoviridae sp.]
MLRGFFNSLYEFFHISIRQGVPGSMKTFRNFTTKLDIGADIV